MSDGVVLVTGGAGFVGSHLVEELLRRGRRVVVVDNFQTGHRSNLASVRDKVEVHDIDLANGDIRPLLAAMSVAEVHNLVGNAYVPLSVENPRLDMESNLLTTFRLLEAVRDVAPSTAFLHVSTASVYGTGKAEPLTEDDRFAPISPYAVSKLAAERYVSVFARLYGVRAAVARLFPIYGPRHRKQVVFDLIRKLHEQPDVLPMHGDGSQVRTFCHVGDVVEALLLVAERAPLQGEAYNIGTEEPVSIAELAEVICSVSGIQPELRYSGSVRPGDSEKLVPSTARVRELGFRPRISLADGIADTVDWYRREIAAVG